MYLKKHKSLILTKLLYQILLKLMTLVNLYTQLKTPLKQSFDDYQPLK